MNDQIKTSAEAAEAAALPRRFEKHTGDGKSRDERSDGLGDKPVKAKSPAEWAYERLILYIQNFESNLITNMKSPWALQAATRVS